MGDETLQRFVFAVGWEVEAATVVREAGEKAAAEVSRATKAAKPAVDQLNKALGDLGKTIREVNGLKPVAALDVPVLKAKGSVEQLNKAIGVTAKKWDEARAAAAAAAAATPGGKGGPQTAPGLPPPAPPPAPPPTPQEPQPKTPDVSGLATKLASFASAGFLVTKAVQAATVALDEYDKRQQEVAESTVKLSRLSGKKLAEYHVEQASLADLTARTHEQREAQRTWGDSVREFFDRGAALERHVRAITAQHADMVAQLHSVAIAVDAATDATKLLNDTAAQFQGFKGLESANEALLTMTRLLKAANAEAQGLIDSALARQREVDRIVSGTIDPKVARRNKLRAQGFSETDAERLAKEEERGQRKGGGGPTQAEISRAEELVGKEIRFLAARTDVGTKAVESAVKAAAQAVHEQAGADVIRKAAIDKLSQLSGKDFKSGQHDALIGMLGGKVGDVRLDKAPPSTMSMLATLGRLPSHPAGGGAGPLAGATFNRIEANVTTQVEIKLPPGSLANRTPQQQAEIVAEAVHTIIGGRLRRAADHYVQTIRRG